MLKSLEPAAKWVWSRVTASEVTGDVKRISSLSAEPWRGAEQLVAPFQGREYRVHILENAIAQRMIAVCLTSIVNPWTVLSSIATATPSDPSLVR